MKGTNNLYQKNAQLSEPEQPIIIDETLLTGCSYTMF